LNGESVSVDARVCVRSTENKNKTITNSSSTLLIKITIHTTQQRTARGLLQLVDHALHPVLVQCAGQLPFRADAVVLVLVV
jgi:hypothetical protein